MAEWNTPYGIPPFEQVQPEHYIPAFKAAMAAELAEIEEEKGCGVLTKVRIYYILSCIIFSKISNQVLEEILWK